ncbi:hypothetical protein AZ78_0701 [Lysobacter capsici AZ78]|uniref:Uncharacterized protein n=1 Tax=Lysobacter capsici AZ78 TaxID=1444315 RepID=A0A120AFK5_9GAMM|nr:hypothetical protein AZ78_0701 [Lysobacter capsici AZ78]
MKRHGASNRGSNFVRRRLRTIEPVPDSCSRCNRCRKPDPTGRTSRAQARKPPCCSRR